MLRSAQHDITCHVPPSFFDSLSLEGIEKRGIQREMDRFG